MGLVGVTAEMVDKCEVCLEAILLHILNLRGFAHTVLVDTWICSLRYDFLLPDIILSVLSSTSLLLPHFLQCRLAVSN